MKFLYFVVCVAEQGLHFGSCDSNRFLGWRGGGKRSERLPSRFSHNFLTRSNMSFETRTEKGDLGDEVSLLCCMCDRAEFASGVMIQPVVLGWRGGEKRSERPPSRFSHTLPASSGHVL